MKKIIIAINIIFLCAVLGIAQGTKQSPRFEDSKDTNTRQRTVKPKDKTSNEDMKDVLLQSGTNLDAKLINSLDVKKTDVGDKVVLKTTKSIKQNGEIIVPKGTKLIGRITEVQQKSKNNKSSKISMVFETLQNKNLSAPINASIVSIASSRANSQVGDLFGADAVGSSRSSSRSTSGGLLGGTTSTVGSVVNTTTNTVGGVTNTVGGATNTVGQTVNGVQISQSLGLNAQGSSTLSAENKNLKLQKGTQFQLQLNQSIQK